MGYSKNFVKMYWGVFTFVIVALRSIKVCTNKKNILKIFCAFFPKRELGLLK